MAADEELRLIARVARLYYQRGPGQTESAQRLALSQAIDAQVVQIPGGIGNLCAEVHANRLTERFPHSSMCSSPIDW